MHGVATGSSSGSWGVGLAVPSMRRTKPLLLVLAAAPWFDPSGPRFEAEMGSLACILPMIYGREGVEGQLNEVSGTR